MMISPSWMLNSGTSPPQRRKGVVHRIDRPARGVGRHGGEQGGIKNAEPHLFAFHVPAARGDTELLMDWIARRFRVPAQKSAGQEQNHHRCPDRPSMSGALDHPAEVIGQPAADGENREHLEKI
jgi:hypothetical protein